MNQHIEDIAERAKASSRHIITDVICDHRALGEAWCALTSKSREELRELVAARQQDFAKKIIKECVSLFDGTKEIDTIGMLSSKQVVERIKNHFKD